MLTVWIRLLHDELGEAELTLQTQRVVGYTADDGAALSWYLRDRDMCVRGCSTCIRARAFMTSDERRAGCLGEVG